MRILLLLLCLVGCSPSCLDDLRFEADSEMKKLVLEFRSIQTKEDLLKRSSFVRDKFNKIAVLLLETRNFSERSSESSAAAEALFVELARLYEIPGIREVVEDLQSEAVRFFDKQSNH